LERSLNVTRSAAVFFGPLIFAGLGLPALTVTVKGAPTVPPAEGLESWTVNVRFAPALWSGVTVSGIASAAPLFGKDSVPEAARKSRPACAVPLTVEKTTLAAPLTRGPRTTGKSGQSAGYRRASRPVSAL
jgi:hypothetical protein